MNILKKRGFTLIELLIAFGIMGIVATAISTFFFSNFRIINKTSIEIYLQSEGESAINLIVQKAMGSNGILLVEENGIDITNNEISEVSTEKNINKIVFGSSDGTNEHYIFQLYGNKLLYGKGEKTKDLDNDNILSENEVKSERIFENVEEVSIKSNENYIASKSISIKIKLGKIQGNIRGEKEVNSEVYFRNKND